MTLQVGGDTGVTQPTSGPETTADAGGGGTSSGTSTEHLVAQNCLAVAEVESVAPTGSWVFEQVRMHTLHAKKKHTHMHATVKNKFLSEFQ